MSNTVISNVTPVASRKDTETERRKSKGIQKGTLLPPPSPPNIRALCRAFHVKAGIEASHGGPGKENGQRTKPLLDWVHSG